jgi:hypothetical protein
MHNLVKKVKKAIMSRSRLTFREIYQAEIVYSIFQIFKLNEKIAPLKLYTGSLTPPVEYEIDMPRILRYNPSVHILASPDFSFR